MPPAIIGKTAVIRVATKQKAAAVGPRIKLITTTSKNWLVVSNTAEAHMLYEREIHAEVSARGCATSTEAGIARAINQACPTTDIRRAAALAAKNSGAATSASRR